MSANDTISFQSFTQTVVLTRGLLPRDGTLRPASGEEIRAALRTHLSCDAGAVMELATFWVDSGGRPVSVLLQAELIAEVATAVDAGRLRGLVFREPTYVSAADHLTLMAKAALAVRSFDPRRDGRSPPQDRPLPAEMEVYDRFTAVFHRALPLVGSEARTQLVALLEDPADFAIAVGTLVALAELHAVAAGEVIDAVVLTAIIACAMIRGISVYYAVQSAVEAVVHFVAFIVGTVTAKTERDLDRAAERLAAGFASVAVGLFMAAVARVAGKFVDSAKKAGSGRKAVPTATKEEMAGKSGSSGNARRAEAPSSQTKNASPKPTTADLIAGQPHKTLDELYRVAEHHQRTLAEQGAKIAAQLGVKFKNPGIKLKATSEEKMIRKKYKNTSKITDVVRGGIVVDTPDQADKVVAELSKKFTIVDEGWKATENGYIDRKILVKFNDGTLGEIQIWEANMYNAKQAGTPFYNKARSLSRGDPQRAELEQKQRVLYSDARKRAPRAWAGVGASEGSGGNGP
ncbi:hypothetical protein [Xanthobacter oligotrophicus]|uniref:hypothetical protein n=1 Tax=Xanthobacter oligotrophicus TaxID=2607286 RepID=UPI0011F1FDA6|nr:hypothetical protein [Xanthobacter oligotrophicus]MCG5233973.1 hypothetical protein [Xanthobacter oligotrophicus]